MKLVRYGKAGTEKPGILDRDGRLRDLSAEVDYIAGPVLGAAELARVARGSFVSHQRIAA
jgi:ureidoglycolate lyase